MSLFEITHEPACIPIANRPRNLFYCHCCAREEIKRRLQPQALEPLLRRNSELSPEKEAQVLWRDLNDSCQFGHGHRFLEVSFDVFDGQLYFAVHRSPPRTFQVKHQASRTVCGDSAGRGRLPPSAPSPYRGPRDALICAPTAKAALDSSGFTRPSAIRSKVSPARHSCIRAAQVAA